MASLTRSQANTQSTANAATQETSLETAFYASVDSMILNSIALGQFSVYVTTPDGADNQTLVNYYVGLGYDVILLDQSFPIPMVIDDPLWINYVNYSFGFPNMDVKGPLRFKISWA